MRPYSVTPAVRLALVAMLAGSTLLACSSKERAPDTARAAGGATPPAPANAVAAAPTESLPGRLTKPVDQYTGDEFYALVQRLPWGGGAERDRPCKGDPGCGGDKPSKHTRVKLDAVDGQDSISVKNVPTNGVVAVRAINNGGITEDRYGFKPAKNLQYYLVVLPGATDSTGRWQFVELDTTSGARRISIAGAGTFTPCNHPFKKNRANRANFYTCPESLAADSAQKSNLVMFAPPKPPVWTACAEGCCIAG
ncbi:MAG TPA: hypothetical protein VF461_03470 [Gemmatimonadaceae bacterium]